MSKELLIKNLDRTVARSFRFRRYDHAIEEYAIARRAGDQLPPPVVFHDPAGDRYHLADGEHRVSAWELDGLKSIRCEVHEGGYREATEYAAGANAKHGLRRTPGDVGLIVTFFLRDPERKKWTDKRLADLIGCARSVIGRYRTMMDVKPRYRTAVDKNGDEYTIDAKKNDPTKHKRVPFGAVPSVKCPHCGRKFNLVRSLPV